jgi:hypothetical protein
MGVPRRVTRLNSLTLGNAERASLTHDRLLSISASATMARSKLAVIGGATHEYIMRTPYSELQKAAQRGPKGMTPGTHRKSRSKFEEPVRR